MHGKSGKITSKKENMFIVEQLKSNNNNGQRTTDTLILNDLNMYDMVSNEHACTQFDVCRKKRTSALLGCIFLFFL